MKALSACFFSAQVRSAQSRKWRKETEKVAELGWRQACSLEMLSLNFGNSWLTGGPRRLLLSNTLRLYYISLYLGWEICDQNKNPNTNNSWLTVEHPLYTTALVKHHHHRTNCQTIKLSSMPFQIIPNSCYQMSILTLEIFPCVINHHYPHGVSTFETTPTFG